MEFPKTTLRNPQHLATLVERPSANAWPDEWKTNPNLIRLVTSHQQWLAHPATEQLFHLLQAESVKLALDIAALSIQKDVEDKTIRLLAAKLQSHMDIIKTTYDTAKFVKAIGAL